MNKRHSQALLSGIAARKTAFLDLPGLSKARRKFLRFFPRGFYDETYLAWERNYKAEAHTEWQAKLGRAEFAALLQRNAFAEIAARAIKIESGRSLLFSFEKMALRDAVRSAAGAERFSTSLFAFLHGPGTLEARFPHWCSAVEALPRKQTRVLTWPLVTVFGFIAQPGRHIFLKPNTTRQAARLLGYEFQYRSKPDWPTYSDYLTLAGSLKSALADMRPRDMIDVQSFLWVQGSDEYR
jgi:hypothetical protein